METKCNIEKSRLSVHSSLSVEKSQSIRESQASSPTLAAAARLSAMIHGKDQVYANAMLVDQVSWLKFFYTVSLGKMQFTTAISFRTAHEQQTLLIRCESFHWMSCKSSGGTVWGPSHCILTFLFQVDDADIKYRSPGEEEVSPASHVDSSSWDSFSVTPPNSGNCSRSRCPSSPHNRLRGIQGSGLENHREQSPLVSPPCPFASSPSFPSSPLASALRLFEGAHKRQPQTGLPLSPSLSRSGCSFTEASRGLR